MTAIEKVSMEHLQETAYCESNHHVTYERSRSEVVKRNIWGLIAGQQYRMQQWDR